MGSTEVSQKTTKEEGERRELLLLRLLEKAVRADRIGCVAVATDHHSSGGWGEKKGLSVCDALEQIDEFRIQARPHPVYGLLNGRTNCNQEINLIVFTFNHGTW